MEKIDLTKLISSNRRSDVHLKLNFIFISTDLSSRLIFRALILIYIYINIYLIIYNLFVHLKTDFLSRQLLFVCICFKVKRKDGKEINFRYEVSVSFSQHYSTSIQSKKGTSVKNWVAINELFSRHSVFILLSYVVLSSERQWGSNLSFFVTLKIDHLMFVKSFSHTDPHIDRSIDRWPTSKTTNKLNN